MILESTYDRFQEQAFCFERYVMMEHVVVALWHRLARADNITDEFVVALERQLAAQEPARTPVRSAHVTGEEGDVESKIIFCGNICNCHQMIECFFGNGIWVGLK